MPDCPPVPRPCRLVAAWLLAVGLFPGYAARGESLDPDPPSDGSFLNIAVWSAAAYSRQAGGTLCWLTGPDGSLRIEVGDVSFRPSSAAGRDPLAELDSLLNRTGNGWTLVLGPDDTGTLNEWGREWRRAPAGLARMARLVTAALRLDPGVGREFGFASIAGLRRGRTGIPRPGFLAPPPAPDGLDDIRRYQLESLDPAAKSPAAKNPAAKNPERSRGFRESMVARGRGSGGPGEVVTLERFGAGDPAGYGMVVTSTRRPGTLRLETPRLLPVNTPEPEVFLPLWPLSQFLESR